MPLFISKDACLTKVNVNLAAILEYLNVWSALRRKVYCRHNQICHFCLLYCICVAAVCPVNPPPRSRLNWILSLCCLMVWYEVPGAQLGLIPTPPLILMPKSLPSTGPWLKHCFLLRVSVHSDGLFSYTVNNADSVYSPF